MLTQLEFKSQDKYMEYHINFTGLCLESPAYGAWAQHFKPLSEKKRFRQSKTPFNSRPKGRGLKGRSCSHACFS